MEQLERDQVVFESDVSVGSALSDVVGSSAEVGATAVGLKSTARRSICDALKGRRRPFIGFAIVGLND